MRLIELLILLGLAIILFLYLGLKKHSAKYYYGLPSNVQVKTKESETLSKCPVCPKGHLKKSEKKRFGIFSHNVLECPECRTVFEETTDPNYYYVNTKNSEKQYADWDYSKEVLSITDLNSIRKTGETIRGLVLEQIEKGKYPPVTLDANVNLKKDEHVLYGEGSTLYEPRAVRVYHGGSRGVSIPTGIKGVRFRVGSFKGQAESHQELRAIDHGAIILTNKRLIFMGGKRTANMDFKKILSIDFMDNGFQVSIETRQKPMMFTVEDIAFWKAYIQSVSK